MSQGLEAYDSGTKESWRNWQWNRIVERLPEFRSRTQFNVKRMSSMDRLVCSEKTVLYLCGPDDFDRECGLQRGFRNENMIAVDVSPENIAKVRSNKGLGICHDINEIVAVASGFRFDVVIADFCGGLSKNALRFINACWMSDAVDEDTVVAINLLRGRDAISNLVRSQMPEAYSREETKHRGLEAYLVSLSTGVAPIREMKSHPNTQRGSVGFHLLRDHTLCMNSYSSVGNQYFDSCVYQWFPKWIASEMFRQCLSPQLLTETAKAKFAAMKAVRTMKLGCN